MFYVQIITIIQILSSKNVEVLKKTSDTTKINLLQKSKSSAWFTVLRLHKCNLD